MESTKNLEWMLKKHYSPDNIVLKNELLDCWNKSVGPQNLQPSERVDAYGALQMLYKSYKHSQFMRIVVMTMRIFSKGDKLEYCKVLDLIKDWENERSKEIREEEGSKQLESNLSGLRALLLNWENQRTKASTLDVFREFLRSENDLAEPEYVIGAIIEQVRRIRRGATPKNNHLEISNGLLKLAQLNWREYENKDKGKLPLVPDDYNVMPNKYLYLLIQYQELLNIGKRGYPIERISGKAKGTDLKEELLHYDSDLEKADVFYTKDIFRWWAYRSLVRNSIRCMSPENETNDLIDKRSKVIKDNDPDIEARKKKYVDGLQKQGTMLQAYFEQAQMLIMYHEALAQFLNNPHDYVNKETRVEKEHKKKNDLALYRAVKADSDGLRKETRLFVNLINRPVRNTRYKATSSMACLENYLEHSIRNVQMASDIVVSKNHYLSVVMQVLLATDLMVRIRWFAGPKNSASANAKQTLGTLKLEDNLAVAEDLQKKVVRTLRSIQRNLELVLPEENRDLQEGPIKLIEHWAEVLEELQLETMNVDNSLGPTNPLSALGYLCHTCGGFVDWKWSKEKVKDYGKKGRKVPDEDLHLELLYKAGNKNHILRISPEKEGYENIYPYVIPLTSDPSS